MCPTPDPVPIVVSSEEIRPGPEEGTWLVTDGWMLRRMETEQALRAEVEQLRTDCRR